ncbi:hypothetical protein CCO03_17100 [Comamonas serinivorans]|uniref:Uncharacterized protein n=1 Tax=Comamonas serinivorans TaxID=1082851 RepID=A0A1Y0ETL3_9BURK|nr:hypothetical protein [Comamonas serinivorans]ARU06943.1 hypothetical protein CCO03_17100 [Comamonas serinivorans]
MTDTELIRLLGGSTVVAKRLGLQGLNGARRVNNWKRRGIPAKVKLEHPWLNPSTKASDGRLTNAQVKRAKAMFEELAHG